MGFVKPSKWSSEAAVDHITSLIEMDYGITYREEFSGFADEFLVGNISSKVSENAV